MRERGRYQIQLMKTRSSSGVGMKIDLEFNIDTLRISDLDESESYGGQASAGSALLSSIKQRQTIAEDTPANSTGWTRATPAEGFDLAKPRVQAQVESSKLRELLNNLPTDDV
jgi:hypothetical protein